MRARVTTSFLLLLALLPSEIRAQYDAPPPPAAWALEGVTVVDADGRTEEGMTLVIRDGVIQTLRRGASVPDDARRIAWDEGTLHVYPGFVDGHGFAETEVPEPSRDGVQPWNPTREVQGLTPRRLAADFLTADGDGLSAYRRKGVVASLVHPGRGAMAGQPSLILHRLDARTSQQLVITPSVGLAMAFQPARGAYPGTLFGVQALIRQAFLDAEHHAARMAAYAGNPRGLEVGSWDEDLRVLERARNGGMPVFFRADGAEDIRRVLGLGDELGFRLVLVGGHEAGALADELARRNVPVLFSLDLPRPSDWKPDEEDEELTPAAYREKRRLEAVYGTPAALHRAGVTLAFTSGGSSATDLFAGVRRAVEYGLPEREAVRALTGTPSDLLGAPHLARLEEGVAANLVVTDRPITEEGVGVTWTFVNGLAEKGRDPRGEDEPPETDEPPANVGGTWRVEIEAQGMVIPMTMVIEQDGTSFTGRMESAEMGTSRIVNGVVRGSAITFGIEMGEMGVTLSVSGTVDGDRVTGSGSGPEMIGSFTFSGARTPGVAARGGDR